MKGILFAGVVLLALAGTVIDSPVAWTGEAEAIRELCYFREQAAQWTGWWDLAACGGWCIYELPSVCVPI